jgi:hypothetical protein
MSLQGQFLNFVLHIVVTYKHNRAKAVLVFETPISVPYEVLNVCAVWHIRWFGSNR